MERLGLVGTCVHIGQAHPRRWENPVHYWTAIQAWLRVMDRHPRRLEGRRSARRYTLPNRLRGI